MTIKNHGVLTFLTHYDFAQYRCCATYQERDNFLHIAVRSSCYISRREHIWYDTYRTRVRPTGDVLPAESTEFAYTDSGYNPEFNPLFGIDLDPQVIEGIMDHDQTHNRALAYVRALLAVDPSAQLQAVERAFVAAIPSSPAPAGPDNLPF